MEILMPFIMVLPFSGLLLFYLLPLEAALKIYIPSLMVAGYCYFVMFKSMRAEAQTGMEAMMGQEALVLEDLDPEGKIQLKHEIWTATARGEKIAKGERVRILDARGLLLVVKSSHEDEEKPRQSGRRQT